MNYNANYQNIDLFIIQIVVHIVLYDPANRVVPAFQQRLADVLALDEYSFLYDIQTIQNDSFNQYLQQQPGLQAPEEQLLIQQEEANEKKEERKSTEKEKELEEEVEDEEKKGEKTADKKMKLEDELKLEVEEPGEGGGREKGREG